MTNYFSAILLYVILPVFTILSQPVTDNLITENNKADLKASGIKSKTMWEFYYNDYGDLKDSIKLMNFYFDNNGNTVERTKFHIYDELNLKEAYLYNSDGKVTKISRYNKNGDVIEADNFKYTKNGLIARERIIQYYNNPNASFYFSILANVQDDSIFSWLQDNLLIEPRLESYTITVNLTDNDPQNHYVVIGDEDDASSMRFAWSQLSIPVQKGLLAWNGNNRTNHKYVVQNLAKVLYTNDKNGNVTSKAYYNTSGNILKRELFFFDENSKYIGYEKYNSSKVLNKESFSYDDNRNVSEVNYTGGRTEYKYDTSGILTGKILYNSSNTVFSRSVYEYMNGKLTTETIYGPDDSISGKISYLYDDKGNPVSRTFYSSDDRIEKETKIVYEFY